MCSNELQVSGVAGPGPEIDTARMNATLTESLRQVARELDAKRRPRRGLDAWYPYYAGFSEAFARSVLTTVPLAAGSAVMDPWNGSGTTTHVADRLGYLARGFDLNPIAALVANAKLARPRDAEHVSGLARRIVASTVREVGPRLPADPLAKWLRPSVARQYRRIESAVLSDLASGSSSEVMKARGGELPPLASFLVLALMRAARSLAAIEKRTNPTWVTPGEARHGTRQMLGARWLHFVHQMATELSLEGVSFGARSHSRVADARSLPVESASIDFVLTSPPYCTRIDYIINTSFELAALGIGRNDPEFATLRAQCMGAPVARRGPVIDPLVEWPAEVRSLLQIIRTHSSPDSASYYYKTYWQYFNDCALSLREIYRALRTAGAAVLVVQTSYYKEICVDLPSLYVSLASSIGFQASIASSAVVQHSLAQINSRSLRHRSTPTYHEAVVTLEKVS